MTLEQIEAEVLALPKDSQSVLLTRLLERLGEGSEIDREVAATWAKEAEERDRAMEDDDSIGIPAAEVFQRVGASLR